MTRSDPPTGPAPDVHWRQIATAPIGEMPDVALRPVPDHVDLPPAAAARPKTRGGSS